MNLATIMHVDMDAFYASVEMAREPSLRSVPMYVGGEGRGVVLSANYPARAHGISGGMPVGRARRLCPDAVAVPPDFETYTDVSAGIMALLRTVTDRVEVASVDEAYLDVSGAVRRCGPPREIGELLRAMIHDEQGVDASVGIGMNRLVAKIASGRAKPDGLVEVGSDQTTAFLHPLAVEALWGVGEVTARRLRELGLTTVADLAHTPVETLTRAFGPHQGQWLHRISWGIDSRVVRASVQEHSVGAQTTLSADTDDERVVRAEVLRMTARAASRMRAAGMCGRGVTLSLRFADFTTITRSAALPTPTDVTDEIHEVVKGLWEALRLQRARIRRVGVRIDRLVLAREAFSQPMLGAPDKGMREAERAADEAVARFGPDAVKRGTLAGRCSDRAAGRTGRGPEQCLLDHPGQPVQPTTPRTMA